MMKSTKHIFLAGVLLLTLSACTNTPPSQGNSTTESGMSKEENTVSIPTPTMDSEDVSVPRVTPTAEPAQSDTFEPNPDLKVVAAFVYDGDTYAVIENTGEQAILNYRIAYINFDKNGFVATRDSDGYELGRADTANLMPGDKDIGGWYGADGAYAVATVINVDYADGTTWEATVTQIDNWAKETTKNFSVEEQKSIAGELKETGVLAENNEYATLLDSAIKHGNQFSSKHDLHFSIKNTSEQGITKLNIFVLEYDENGFPVSVSPYDTYCINGHRTGGTVNLAVGQSGSYSDDLFLSPTTTQIKVIISNIEFQDGTDWINPYLYEWLIGNNGSY